MVFSSIMFMFTFLPIVLALYFIAPKGLRNLVLFLTSLVFYAWGEPIYVILMIFSTVVDYTHGILVKYFQDKGKDNLAKCTVASSVIINLGLLGIFKYTGFIVDNINAIFRLSLNVPELALPIGISFYTFQTMSYTIDVYRKDAEVQKNIISFGAYVALFPQLIAGPIVRYKDIAKQLNERTHSISKFSLGIRRFIMGLGKKVLFANSIGMLWDQVNAQNEMSFVMSWIGITAFALQIYFDFSGYSDMAIGLGHMFGFDILENFNYPYISKSITEFWRRWHISLGTWFREYVYIPLGGNRCGKVKLFRNIFIVWILTGIWHGASWNFALWGLYFGIMLTIEKVFLYKKLENMPKLIRHIYTLIIVAFSWCIFAFENTTELVSYAKAMIGIGVDGFINQETMYMICNNLVVLIILLIAATDIPKRIYEKYKETKIVRGFENVALIIVLILSIAYLVDATYNPFLYFRF